VKKISLVILLPMILLAQIDDYATNQTERKFYVSGLVQYGPGFEKIKAGSEYIPYTRETNDIYIRPGGGYGVEGIIGSDIIPSIAVEFGIGILRSGKVVHTEHIVFDKSTLRASLIYKLRIYKYHKIYFGGGFSAVQNSILKIEQSDETLRIKYHNPKGFNIISGLQFNYTNNFFLYGDIKYNIMSSFKIKNAEFSGESMVISNVDSKYHTYDGNGIQFSFGVGYYLK